MACTAALALATSPGLRDFASCTARVTAPPPARPSAPSPKESGPRCDVDGAEEDLQLVVIGGPLARKAKGCFEPIVSPGPASRTDEPGDHQTDEAAVGPGLANCADKDPAKRSKMPKIREK